MKLSEAEKAELIKNGRVSGWVGHHTNSVSANDLEMARNPDNIRFVRGMGEHFEIHGNNWQKPTEGPLLDRLAKLSGSALLAFFIAYDEKMKELSELNSLVSDPDSWWALINPFNNIPESQALLAGLIAADNAMHSSENNAEDENQDESTRDGPTQQQKADHKERWEKMDPACR